MGRLFKLDTTISASTTALTQIEVYGRNVI